MTTGNAATYQQHLMAIDAATAALLGAGISGIFSTLTAVGIIVYTKRSEERRHWREIVIRTAVENWRVADEAARQAGGRRLPLDVYLIHMLKFGDLLTKPDITVEDVRRNHAEHQIVVDEAIRLAEAATERMRAEG